MKKIYFIVFVLFANLSFAQVSFEPGYYIDNDNRKIEVLIKNEAWLDSPTQIAVKNTEASKEKEIYIDTIKEFGIIDGVSYIKASVNLDSSSDQIDRLSRTREPQFEKKQVLLKKILEGKASLYEYINKSNFRYFFKIDGDTLKPLVYKRYMREDRSNDIFENNAYKQTLRMQMLCSSISDASFKNLKYKRTSLASLFKKYNTCFNSQTTEYRETSKIYDNNNRIKLRFKAGVRSHKLDIIVIENELDVDREIGFQFGAEAEFIFKFNRNKWSALTELTYFNYDKEFSGEVSPGEFTNISAAYSGLEISIAARHSFFIDKNSRIFITAGMVAPLAFENDLLIENFKRAKTTTAPNLMGAIGFEINNISIEAKIQGARNIDRSVGNAKKYKNASITLGYSF